MKQLLFLLLIPAFTQAQKNYSERLTKYMEAQAAVKGFSGSVLVMKKNAVLLKKGYGLADREWNIPNSTDTKFRIGSVTKQFTAACILQLVEQGKLNLDDKLSKFLPSFPKGDSVSIHMLLNHTSGIASYTDLPAFKNVVTQSLSMDSMIRFFSNSPYNFSPGTQYRYNNSGFFLLGYILEKVSGLTYKDYLRKNILDKIGMDNSGIDTYDTILPMRAKGYNKNRKMFTNAEYISLLWPYSAGIMYSTLDDLYQWDRALYGNTLLTNASKQKMFTPGKNNYGYGIVIDSMEKHYRIGHSGSIPGFVTNISRYVNDDVCIVVLSNDGFNAPLVSDGLAKILFDLPVEFPYVRKEIKLNPALLDRYIGIYKAFLTIEVIKKDNKLYRHREGTPDIELKAESETVLYYDDDSDRRLEFDIDATGKITKIWFVNNGERGEMERIK